jgi:hypothetical protein
MTTPAPPLWVAWAPPIDPPTAGGLPAAVAQDIASALWVTDPHLCAALMWETYAAMLPPTPAVASVSTGVQSVSYSPASPTGDYGLAIQRADWHRSYSSLTSVPLFVAAPPLVSAEWTELGNVWFGEVPGGVPELPPAGSPVAAFTWTPSAPGPNTAVTFDGSGSTQVGSPIATYDWVFGIYAAMPDGGPSVTWQTPGIHDAIGVTLTVTDENGLTGFAEQVIVT